ncbi:MAG: NAD(P)H-hydrate dehydratase [Bauldia sp.]
MREPLELLTPAEMAEADARAIAAGIPGIVLMERAGRAVADAARRLWRGGWIAVLCGPGNNGGDGFVAARILRNAGYRVTVLLHGNRDLLEGDAAVAAARFLGVVRPADRSFFLGLTMPRGFSDPEQWKLIEPPGLIIDALYGAGVRLPLSAEASALVRGVNAGKTTFGPRPRPSPPHVLAVVLPSGVDGATGAVAGDAIRADATVTFHRLKPGHLLLPGRTLCGAVTLADIGIPEPALFADSPYRSNAAPMVPDTIQVANDSVHDGRPKTFVNRPALWRRALPVPTAESHKYTRGHAVVVSGPASATGAARLAARAALRIGAGLVTVASPPSAVLVNAAQLTSVMVKAFDGPEGLATLLDQRRVTAAAIGPGLGTDERAAALIEAAIASPVALVLDADALSAFAADPRRLADLVSARRAPTVATPHDGEFARILPDITGSRLDRARAAAKRSGAVVVLKGADTVVASPNGRAAIADNAPPTLATAGSGDTLAGLIVGLLAQGMPAFEAAAAAVFIHGEAARAFGPGLIAEDLAEEVPAVLGDLGI